MGEVGHLQVKPGEDVCRDVGGRPEFHGPRGREAEHLRCGLEDLVRVEPGHTEILHGGGGLGRGPGG